MLYGLSNQNQAPPTFASTNKHGVPHKAIIASSALLLIAALLNYIFPDATLVFTYVTTISTVLFVVVWALIIVLINYSRKIQNFIRKRHINYQAVNTWDTLYLFSLFCICLVIYKC